MGHLELWKRISKFLILFKFFSFKFYTFVGHLAFLHIINYMNEKFVYLLAFIYWINLDVFVPIIKT